MYNISTIRKATFSDISDLHQFSILIFPRHIMWTSSSLDKALIEITGNSDMSFLPKEWQATTMLCAQLPRIKASDRKHSCFSNG